MLDNLRVSLDAPSGVRYGFIDGEAAFTVPITPAEILAKFLEHEENAHRHAIAEAAERGRETLAPAPFVPTTPEEAAAAYARIPEILVERFSREIAGEKLGERIAELAKKASRKAGE